MICPWLITCEHASAKIPPRWRALLTKPHEEHEITDLGAKDVAQALALALGVACHCGQLSRLVVDLNRSLHHPRLHAPAIKQGASTPALETLLAQHYRPFREAVINEISHNARAGNRTIHLSVHSFTRHFANAVRRTDVGLLYDPSRPSERRLADAWIPRLREAGSFTVHRNQPYRGTADGHTTALRRQFPDRLYAGIEVEICNDLLATPDARKLWAGILARSVS